MSGGKKATLRWADPDGCASKYHVYIQIEDNQSNWLTATSDGSSVDLSSSTMEWSHTFPTLIHGSTGLKIGVWCDASSQDNVATPPGRQVGGTVNAFFTVGSAGNAPVEPGSVAAKAAGDGELALSWTAPSNPSAEPIRSSIVQYQVQWKSGSEDWDATNRQAVSELPPHLTHTIAGLTGGVEHTVRVRAISASHDGAWSEGAAGTPVGAMQSSDATLSALAVTYGSGNTVATLRPGFASATKSYRAAVEHSAEQVTVTPTANAASPTIEYLDGSNVALADADAGTTGHQVALAVGLTTFKVKVTDGAETETYRVVMERDSDQTWGWTPTRDFNTLVAAGNRLSTGMGGNATTLWVADDEDDRVYAYTLATGLRDTNREFNLHNNINRPRGMWSDSTTLWVADEGFNQVYAYSLATGNRNSGSDVVLTGANANAKGIWSNETTLWVADSIDNKIYAYALSGGKRQDGTDGTTNMEFPLDSDNASPYGIWSDGTTLWVLDSSDAKAYAYALSGGTRQDGTGDTESLDFDLYSANGLPTGIWSVGTTLWVVDSTDDKIYSYNAPEPAVVSNDATLRGLLLSGVTFTPPFASGTIAYTADVVSSVSSTTVTATPTHAGANVVIKLGGVVDDDGTVTLAAGANVITVEVTAEDGKTMMTYTVTVNFTPVVTLALDPDTIDEDAGTAVNVTATVAAAQATEFTVTVTAAAVSPATDSAYRLSVNTTLTFAVNATESAGTVTITPSGNTVNELDKVITVSGTLAGVTGVTGPADVELTITDNDDPVVTHTLTLHRNDAAKTLLDPAMIPENVGQVCMKVTATTEANLPPEKDGATTVSTRSGTARSPGDYPSVSHNIFLPVSRYSLQSGKYVAVREECAALRIVDDSVNEDNEQFRLFLQDTVGTPPSYRFEQSEDSPLVVTIKDNDPEPSLSIADAGGAEGEDLEFTVTLDPASGREVTVDWAVDEGTATAGADYTDGSGTLTFAAGDTTKTVTVAALQDTDPEGDETFTVTLSNARNAAIGDAGATGTIAANDAVLTALALSGVTLVPPFDSAETEYTASVASTVENTMVTATPNPAGAAVVIKLGGTVDDDGTVDLAVGANVITVEVATGSTYMVTVTRAAAATTGFALHTDNADGWGLWGNADTFWVSDSNDDKIYAYDRSDDSRDADKDIDATNATTTRGLWSDGAVMWVVDNRDDVGTKKLRPFSLAGVYDSDSAFDLHTDHDHGRGAWSDGTTIWVSDEDDDKLYAYTLNGGARNTGAEFDLHADNADAQGIWSDDTTIWVADSADDKVYAYALSDGTRQDGTGSTTDLEFALGGNNTDPRGLWSDGDTMYVVDSADDKIYDYALPAQPASDDATLSALAVTHGSGNTAATLRPPFAAATKSYRAAVANSVAQVTVTPTANAASATIEYLDDSDMALADADSGANGHQVAVAVGLTTFKVKVTDGTATETYTVVMERDSDQVWGWTPTRDWNNLQQGDVTFLLPEGLYSDGTTLWVLDLNVLAYTLETQVRDTTKEISLYDDPSNTDIGISSDGTTMYVLADPDDKIRAYALSDGMRQDGTGSTTDREFDLHADNDDPGGIWSDRTTLWVSDYGDDKIYAYMLADGTRVSETTGGTTTYPKDVTLHSDNEDASGIWSNGTTMWVVDNVDNKVYAYTLATGGRDIGSEFGLHSENDNLRSIWSHGTTMLVPDRIDHKIYTYNAPASAVSGDPSLSALGVSPGTLRPEFAGDTFEYRAAVENSATQVTVSPTATVATAAIEYLDGNDAALADADTVAAGHQVALAVGLTTFQVKVTDGTATALYTVTMERDSDEAYGWTPTRDIRALAAGNLDGKGLWSDATTLWVVDAGDHKVYAYTLADGERTATSEFNLDAENGDPSGIWSDDTTIWVADRDDHKLYAYRLADGTRVSETDGTDTTYPKDVALSNNPDPEGMWSDGTTLWVADNGHDRVFAYTLADGERVRQAGGQTNFPKDVALSNGDAAGIWSDGTTLWVVDSDDGKVYAYTLNGGARDADNDFDVWSESDSIWGIWGDATTIWVPDRTDSKIYTYNAPAQAPADTTAPTVAITLGAGVSEPLNGGASSITFTFSEAIDPATFTASDITVKAQGTSDDAGTVTEPAADAGATPANSVFTVDLTPTANTEGNLVVGLAADAVLDGNSNGNEAQSATFAFDAVKPTLSSRHFTGRTVTLTFSEPLDESSVPSLTAMPLAFGVSSPVLPNMQFTTIVIFGPTVTLTQPSAAVPASVLEMKYTKPDDNPLRDLAGNAVETTQDFDIASTTSNAVPVFPSGTITRSVAENTASGQNVGAPVAATDANTGDTLTYSLEGTDGGSFTIVGASGQIQTSAALNHEAKSSYSVTVKVNDGTVNATKAVTISVTDVDEPPDQPATPIVSAKSGTTDSLDVSWSAPANTGPPITDYDVRYRIGTTGSFTSHPFSGAGRSTTIGGLTADTEYEVQVRASNVEDTSPWSASGTGSTNAATSIVSNDATLSALTLSPTDISSFQSGTPTYSVDVANSVGSVTVTPTANQASATITVNGATVASGSGRAVSVDVGSNTITIVVTAEDGNATESYTVTVTRAVSGAYDGTPQLAAANAAPWGIWGNADTLWVSDQAEKKLYAYGRSDGSRVAARDIDIGGELTGASRRTYGIWSDGTRMWVADASAGALLAYGVSDGARQSGRDVALAEDVNDYANDHEQPRGVGSDGTTLWVADLRTGALHDKLYAYGVSKGARQSGREFDLAKSTEYANTNDNSNPAGVWTDGTTLWVADEYDAKIYAYAVSGGARVSEVSGGSTVYPKDVTLDGENETPAGIWSDGLRLWVVDRVVGKLYAYDLPGAVASDDATLSALTLSGVTLSPSFASGTVAYTARVAHGVSSTTVTATPTHAGASREITPADADANAAGHQVNLTAGGDTVITVEVTAQDKMTTKTYRVTVTRAAAQAPQSDDATLSALSLSGVTLSPAFASRTTGYRASVGNSVESTTVTATTNHASATVVIMPADADANTAGHQVNLGVGDTEITAEVTAEDGSAMKTYTVTVTRAPAGASSDATLSELTLSGVTLAFAPETLFYTASVDNSVSATTVTAVTTDDKATRKILIDGVQDLDADVDLAVGDNTITVEVTAEDGTTRQTYTVTVTRAAQQQAAGPTLVSNTGQATGRHFSLSDSGNSKLAQRFTTGPNEGGYRLTSIGVEFGDVPAASSDVVVTIRLQTEREADPADTAFATLTNPATFTANAVNTFTAPANTVLAASTTYFVHVEFAPSATTDFSIGGTASADEDAGAAEGWSIGDTGRRYSVQRGSWNVHRGYVYQITVASSAAGGVPNIVVAASKRLYDRRGGPDDGGYRERDLIIALYNLESDATWSGDNYSGDPSTLDYVHRTDILDAGGGTTLTDLDRRNECEGPAYSEPNHIQMSVDREIRKVNENPETRGGGVIDTGDCANDFAVTVTVWEGAAFESQGRGAAPYVQLTCRFDGTANDDFRALPWGGEHEGPGWYYHEHVLCTDANGDLAPDSTPTIPALNWEPPEYD